MNGSNFDISFKVYHFNGNFHIYKITPTSANSQADIICDRNQMLDGLNGLTTSIIAILKEKK